MTRKSFLGRIFLAACAAALSGCFNLDRDELTDAVVAGEKPVAMEGSDAFFSGMLTAKVTLSRGIGHGLKKAGRGKDDYTYEAYAHGDTKTMIGSPLPPVTMHILVTNHADHPVTISIPDFDSDMGNFVVDPESLTIAAGATAEPTPMVSDLGVNSDSIPFKVTIKYGASKESRTILVKVAPPAAPAGS
jgi:hypothetical protein